MSEHTIYVSSEDNEAICDLEVTVEYNVYGSYRPATHEDPPQYPEVEIESFRVSKELAELLGGTEVLDEDKLSKYVDIAGLHQTLLEQSEEDYDEPEPDYDDF